MAAWIFFFFLASPFPNSYGYTLQLFRGGLLHAHYAVYLPLRGVYLPNPAQCDLP